MQPPYRPASYPVSESRRTRLATVSEAAGGQFTVSGFQEIDGIGEVTFVVNFPVRFFEMPIFTYGAHLGSLTGAVPYLVSGGYPSVNALVVAYNTGNGPNTGTPYFLGASIAVTVTGQQNQIVTLHYEFKGRAMTYLPSGQDVA